MSLVQRKTAQNTFPNLTSSLGSLGTPSPLPKKPAIHTGKSTNFKGKNAPRSREQVQNLRIVFSLVIALGVLLAGMCYLFGYALITKESFRQAQLHKQLKDSHEKNHSLREELARAQTPKEIEIQAKRYNMVRVSDQNTITLE